MTGHAVRLVLTGDANTIAIRSDSRTRVIHREDADPEHRFFEYRIAAAWFGNPPAGEVAQ